MGGEHSYTLITLALCALIAPESEAERHNVLGRSDLTVFLPGKIYILELKYNGSLIAAETQRDCRNYGRELADRNAELYALHLNFIREPEGPLHIEGSLKPLDFRTRRRDW